jgi:hypothetical protein
MFIYGYDRRHPPSVKFPHPKPEKEEQRVCPGRLGFIGPHAEVHPMAKRSSCESCNDQKRREARVSKDQQAASEGISRIVPTYL